MRFRREALIEAQPDRVWEVLSDWELQSSWMPDVAWMRLVGTERGLGARLEVKTRVFGIPLAMDRARVTAWDPGRRLAIEHEGVVIGRGEWLLEPDPASGGTRFTWIEELRMPPPFLGDLALLVYSPWQRWMLGRSLGNLKRLAEASAP